MTSTNASFFLYFTSLFRHDVAPVACIVILLLSSRTACSDFIDSVVMYIFSVSVSLFCGYPKSRISAREASEDRSATI